MNTTIVQISNIFNLMTQADSRLKFYHFGWRSDINKNIDNNFDPGNSTGRQFPALHFDIPDYFEPTQEENYLSFKQDISINLYFDNLQAYDNSGSQIIKTLIEQWAELKQIAEDFICNLAQVLEYYNIGFIRTQPRYEPRANLHNDNILTFQVSFVLSHVAPCTQEANKIILSSLPETIEEKDLENNLNFIVPELPVSNISLWLDAAKGINTGSPADLDNVYLWADQSGNGNDFEQLTATSQPLYKSSGINGQPSIVFDVKYLIQSAAVLFGTDYTIYCVFKTTPNTTATAYKTIFSFSNNAFFAQGLGRVGMAVDTGYNAFYYDDRIARTPIISHDTNAHYFTISNGDVGGTDKKQIFADGVQYIDGTASIDSSQVQHFIGAWNNQFGNFEISEIIGYNVKHTPTEQAEIENYLKIKYSL